MMFQPHTTTSYLILLFAYFGFFYSTNTHADGALVKAADNIVMSDVSLHKQNYFFPISFRADQEDIDNTELIFQFSAKLQMFTPKLHLGYTQRSFWLFADADNSKPFRETNYTPEIFYEHSWFESNTKKYGALYGFEHQSNGAPLPTSRSWNRIYFWPYIETPQGNYSLKTWYRVPDKPKKDINDPNGDDNPDIYESMGYAELYCLYKQSDNEVFSVMLRGNPTYGKGALQTDYSWPLSRSTSTHAFVRLFTGYGESLLDYQRSITRLSFGFEFR